MDNSQPLTVSTSSLLTFSATLAALALWLVLLFPSKPTFVMPAWVPLEVGISAAVLESNGLASRLLRTLRRRSGPLFGLTRRHAILFKAPSVERLLARADSHPLSMSMLLRAFGASLPPSLSGAAFFPFHKELLALLSRAFVNDVAATAAIKGIHVPEKVDSLLSYSTQAAAQHQWERAAEVKLLPLGDEAEVNLQDLLRDFGACLAIPTLFGHDLLARNPSLLDDLWIFDAQAFGLLAAGLPQWLPLPSLREGIAARRRLQNAMAGFFGRLDQYEDGQPVDFGADMSDVSTVERERNRVYRRHGLSVQERGKMEISILWGQNANTQPLIFWFLVYVYAAPQLLDELRREVESCLTLSPEPPRITAMDIDALSHNCPLLKSCFLETLRLANKPTSIRYLSQPLVVPEAGVDTALPSGTWISAPHVALQRDESVFPHAHEFLPERFLQTQETDCGRRIAHYGSLKPWGAGTGICKGRTFAEREALTVVACFITLWDLRPAGGEAQLKVPTMVPGTGVARPRENLRVVLRRRCFSTL
ncbi:hypothetical protein CDD82_900 [Ophiocordyceps australis]|uniref:Cytochrome P450 n=1 Tax=Ophiocordyceps australis TaxID=1399860 RepID=A0A2C5YET8_9HYPO|nr:hypothetical protein CDD82_900 [Ophiocordyceps australis]